MPSLNFKQAFLIALVPVLISSSVSIITYLSVIKLDNKIKEVSALQSSLDLYNQLSPNISFEITEKRLEFAVYNKGSAEEANKAIERFKSIGKNYKSILENQEISNDKKIALVKSLFKESGFREEDSIPVVNFYYCVKNNGKTEQFIETPLFTFYTNYMAYEDAYTVEPYISEQIGIIPPSSRSCMRARVKYSDIPKGDFNYTLSISSRPSERAVHFIYKDSNDVDIKSVSLGFRQSYSIEEHSTNQM
jgi:hypothetical protein